MIVNPTNSRVAHPSGSNLRRREVLFYSLSTDEFFVTRNPHQGWELRGSTGGPNGTGVSWVNGRICVYGSSNILSEDRGRSWKAKAVSLPGMDLTYGYAGEYMATVYNANLFVHDWKLNSYTTLRTAYPTNCDGTGFPCPLMDGSVLTIDFAAASNPTEEGLWHYATDGTATQILEIAGLASSTSRYCRSLTGALYLFVEPTTTLYRVNECSPPTVTVLNASMSGGGPGCSNDIAYVSFDSGSLYTYYFGAGSSSTYSPSSADFTSDGCVQWNGVEFVAYDSGNHVLHVSYDGISWNQVALSGSALATNFQSMVLPN